MQTKKVNYKKVLQQSIAFSVSAFLIAAIVFMVFEPVITEAITDSAVVSATVTEEITITSPDDLSLSPSIPGITGNHSSPATGSLTWTVKTVNTAGFNMKIKASTNPAMQLGGGDATYQFADYTNESPLTYAWASPSSGAAWFGFTVEAATDADTVAAFLDNGSTTCGTGSTAGADTCWGGLATTDTDLINRSTNTDLNGEAEVVKFYAESYAKFLKEGSYTATVTVTAAMN